jgi:hypothetical protein
MYRKCGKIYMEVVMEDEKKYFAGWWFWVLLIVIATGAILTGLNYAGLIGKTAVERVVFENSYQYSEARKTEIATYEAQLAEISSRLSGRELDSNVRANLEAQRSALNIQLNVARSKR